MELYTKVNITPLKEKLTLNNKVLIIGSCFANEIGRMLKECGFNISVNPFGTLYNPVSIVQSLKRLASGERFAPQDIINISLHSTEGNQATLTAHEKSPSNCPDICNEAKYCSFYHHSSFASSTPDSFLQRANEQLCKESAHFMEADTIIITLGTSWVFRHIARNMIVSNCHKINPKEFIREFIPIDECIRMLAGFIELFPQKRFIFTVSPIRHLKDGAHGNQISKASLLLAVDTLLRLFPANTYYFPAYEIVLDELRDYRFYAEDMIHPSGVAVKYIFERFKESCIAQSEYEEMQQFQRAARQTLHKPLLN